MRFIPLTSLPDNSPEKLVWVMPCKKVKSTIVQRITPLTFVETKSPESRGILQLHCISHEEGSLDTKAPVKSGKVETQSYVQEHGNNPSIIQTPYWSPENMGKGETDLNVEKNYNGKLIPHKLIYPPQKQSEHSIINTDDKDSDYVPDVIELVKKRHIPIVCNVLLESFLGRFQRYLQGPEGGNKEIRNAKQIVSEVRRMFVALKTLSLEELFEKNNIHDHYLMGYCIDNKHTILSGNTWALFLLF